MIELRLNKESKLSFEMNIEGNKEKPKARLIFEMGNKMELAIAGKITEGKIEVTIPSLMDLKEKLSGDNVRGYIEVISDSTYFVPWEDYFSLKAPVSVQVESTSVKSEENNIRISIKETSVNESIEVVNITKNYKIPKTKILLEAGDKVEILSEKDEHFKDAYKIEETFQIPGTTTVISKQNRIRLV